MSSPGEAVAVSAARAAEVAAARGDMVSRFLQTQARGTRAAGKARWQLVTLEKLDPKERAAVAWLIADAIMRSRCGRAPIFRVWRDAVLAGQTVTESDRKRLFAFTRSVFGTPEKPGNQEHLEGHVAEWLWYLLMQQQDDGGRKIVLLEPPKFSVTEPGADGFVVYAIDGVPLVFRLWELKKHVGKGGVDATVRGAYGQLRAEGDRYLAQLTAMHADKDGDIGDLCAQLVDLWVEADGRAGAGVGVTSATLPPPRRCFTTMGTQLKQFTEPGQLEGMLCAVEEYRALACDVRRFLWSAL
jgi:hypothetical protein